MLYKLRTLAKQALTNIADFADLEVRSKNRARRDVAEKARLFSSVSLLDASRSTLTDAPACVIFSKDRPVQLALLLESLHRYATPLPQITVLFTSTDCKAEEIYAELESIYSESSGVKFVKENKFRDDLAREVKKISSSWMFFLVDDIVFIDCVNFSNLKSHFESGRVVSLRLGVNITRSYTTHRNVPRPKLMDLGGDLLGWRWSDGIGEWGYVHSVDGNIFPTEAIQKIAAMGEYAAPNSFEDCIGRFDFAFNNAEGVCFETSRLVNIPANRVQSEALNRAGSVSNDALISAWRQGRKLDLDAYSGLMPPAPHHEYEYRFCPR